MKTATIPSLRVDPDLRHAAEEVLRPDENLSGFMETSLRAAIVARKLQSEFVARGLVAQARAQSDNDYHDAEIVHAGLRDRLIAAKAKSGLS